MQRLMYLFLLVLYTYTSFPRAFKMHCLGFVDTTVQCMDTSRLGQGDASRKCCLILFLSFSFLPFLLLALLFV